MFKDSSRYANVETAHMTRADGQVVAYKRRRFLPQGDTMPTMLEANLTEGDRLDLIAYRTLGDPEMFWRICDANNMMNPLDVADEVSRTLKIPQIFTDFS